MRSLLANWLGRLGRWLRGKSQPGDPLDPNMPGFVDAYRRHHEPSPLELLAELKNTAWSCAALNAAVCASFPPRLYVRTAAGQAAPRCLTRALSPRHPLAVSRKSGERVEEVVEHPLLSLLDRVNPSQNAHDLWELTTLYQEVHGSAYWLLETDPLLGVPASIWVLPSQFVRPVREPGSPRLVDFYEYRGPGPVRRFAPETILHFRYPDPREPYLSGLSPLRACFESAALASQFLAYKRSLWDNAALPGVIVSPQESISQEERDRLEASWTQRFRRGGNGRVLVADTGLNVDVLQTSLADVAALAEAGATQADIANAFGVPLAFLTTDTNLANLQAAEHQHASKAIRPRLKRRDEKLNEQLVPLFDPTGRLFLASDDPVPGNWDAQREQEQSDLKWGVRTINEVRSDHGLPPVEWGDKPWLPASLLPTDYPERPAYAPQIGRGKEPPPTEGP
jgi:HK97 family phage portal protein